MQDFKIFQIEHYQWLADNAPNEEVKDEHLTQVKILKKKLEENKEISNDFSNLKFYGFQFYSTN